MISLETYNKIRLDCPTLKALEDRAAATSQFGFVLLKPGELEDLIGQIRWLQTHLREAILCQQS